MPRKRRLTSKQRTFVAEYLIDLNATQAAIRAGYKPDFAAQIGHELLEKTIVQRKIQEAMKARAARLEITSDKVVRELMLVAFSNVADYVITDRGNLKTRQTADRGSIRAVSSFKRKVRVVRGEENSKGEMLDIESEVRMWDKTKALNLLCQHLGILKAPETPTLEALLAALPTGIADQLRQLLAQGVLAGPDSSGDIGNVN